MEREAVDTELFGLAGTFPRPAWVVIDAARDHRFTGEISFESTPTVHLYFDRGRIYLAERITDPSLGSRLIDAGVLNAAQLEHGTMRLGEVDHLGRLFERVPSVDRYAVLVTSEMMTEECVSWLAGQQVPSVDVRPYRHHPSGVHRWDRPDGWHDLNPGDPLPAPALDDAPVEISPPEPPFSQGSPTVPFSDDMIVRWDEPSWLDLGDLDNDPATQRAHPHSDPRERTPTLESDRPTRVDDGLGIRTDWVDRLTTEGSPNPGGASLPSGTAAPAVRAEPVERFEVKWPSGEVDEQFGGSDTASHDGHHPDLDRAGPTARLVRTPSRRAGVDTIEPETEARPEATTVTDDVDDVVLAVRAAVASIETGGLVTRSPLATLPAAHDLELGAAGAAGLVPPGRVAVRSDVGDWTANAKGLGRATMQQPTRSVFDEVAPQSDPESCPTDTAPPAEVEPARTGALRRLIGGLRRH